MRPRAEGFEIEYKSEASASLRLDPRIYSKEALLRACYWCTNIAYVHMPESPDNKFTVVIKLKHSAPSLEDPRPISIQEFVGEFCNSLLDYELRRQVEAETAGIRQLVLAKAFSESGVLEDEPPGEVEDTVGKDKPVNEPVSP